MRDKMWMTVWSGGYEAPSYQMHFSYQRAVDTAKNWATTMDDGDWIDVLELDLEAGIVTRLDLDGEPCVACGGAGVLTAHVAGYATSSRKDELQAYPCPSCSQKILP